MLNQLKAIRDYWGLPATARAEVRNDRAGPAAEDPGPAAAIDVATRWLKRAQDLSSTSDGGVARDFSLVKGWNSSYPETTGYIVPSLLWLSDLRGDDDLRQRSRRMLDWFREIQFPEGGFQGGRIDSEPRVPVTFNTGQILLGLCAGAQVFGDEYVASARSAASWLRDSLDPDGCWRRHPTPFAAPGEKAYETHVSWGLFEAERVLPGEGFGDAGLRQVDWATTKQRANGWIESCCLSDPDRPLTHTLGYWLRGVLEAYRLTRDDRYLASARLTADALLASLRPDGALPGRLRSNWQAAVDWACLTGNAQIASCWFMLAEYTGNSEYRKAAARCIGFVRRTILMSGDPDRVGGVKGSFPVDGDYGAFEYLNWAAKFVIDACLHEQGHFQEPI